MKWAALAVVALAVVGGGVYLFRPVAPPPQPPVTPTPPIVNNTPPPPQPPPGPRDISGAESVKFNTMLSAKKYPEADAFIAKMESVWKEQDTVSMKNSLQESRLAAQNEEIGLAMRALAQGNLAEAQEHLEKAAAYAPETDALLIVKIKAARKQGNCPGVLATVEQMSQQFPTSGFLKQANDYRRGCLAQPLIGPKEVQYAMKSRQADIDACLKTPLGPDQTASTIDVAWTVTTIGTVAWASCTTWALAKSQVCDCLTTQVKQLRFVEKPGTTVRRATVTLPLGTPGEAAASAPLGGR